MADVQIAVIDQQNTQIAVIDQQDTQIVLAAPPETQINVAVPGTQGPAGEGVPQGGIANQVLFKQSGTDYDTAWSEITSAMIGDLEIVNADVSASAAIAGTKISPDFGSQNVVTTGTASAAAFIPSGNTAPSNGLYLPAANQVALSTDGTGRLFIDASGNVGLATNPTDKLSLEVGAANSGVSIYFSGTEVASLRNDAGNATLNANNANLKFETGGDERLRITSTGELKHLGGQAVGSPAVYFAGSAPSNSLVIDSSGRLLIGTASHSGTPCQLEVASSTGSIVNLRNTDTSIINNDIIGRINFVGDDPATGKVGARITAQSEGTWADINYLTKLFFETAGAGDSSPQVRMTIKSDGKVGVGTTDPQNLLSLGLGSGTTTRILGQYGNNVSTTLEVGAGQASTFRGGMRIAVTDTFAGSVGDSVVSFHTTKDGGGTVQRLTIDEDGKVGIGTTDPSQKLQISGTSSQYASIVSTDSGNTGVLFGDSTKVDEGYVLYANSDNSLRFGANNGQERARIDSDGRLLVGPTSRSDTSRLVVQGNIGGSGSDGGILALSSPYGASIGGAGAYAGQIKFTDSLGGVFGNIACQADGANASGDYPGRLVFSTTADGAPSPTPRMTIDSGGSVLIGETTNNQSARLALSSRTKTSANTCKLAVDCGSTLVGISSIANSTVARTHIEFENGAVVGSITTSGSATAYNTSSDYRLKENVVPVTDGITRLQQLKPSRFNFIADPNTVVDGFIAHEAQAVVPECVTGEKDAMDDKGNPVYQGIDQSKLVPLLTAALQEAIGEIESLKARVAALESA